jgi:hypothetical protein
VSARRFGVMIIQALHVVTEVRHPNRMKRRQHHRTHYREYEIVGPARQTQIPMKHVVRNPEAREEKHEGRYGRNGMMAKRVQKQLGA